MLHCLMFEKLATFLMNDQPTTCPNCGVRCDDLASFYHTNAKCLVMRCLNTKCSFTFYEEEDEYYLKLWGII